jgi:hypothetical protein
MQNGASKVGLGAAINRNDDLEWRRPILARQGIEHPPHRVPTHGGDDH